MSKKRFIRFRKRSRRKDDSFDLELNSLLDVLVILLVFLIMNYTSAEVELAIHKDIMLPTSVSNSIVHKGVTIQFSKTYEVFIEDKLVTSVANGSWNEDNASQIRNELTEIRDRIERISMESVESKSFSGVINLIMDREVDYLHIKKLMDVSTEIGFEQFKFIVIES